MIVEFEYSLGDIAEAQKLQLKSLVRPASKSRSKSTRARFVGWVLFIVLAAIMFSLLNAQGDRSGNRTAAPSRTEQASPDWLRDVLIPLLPWLLFFGFIVFAGVLVMRKSMGRQAFESLPSLKLRKRLDADDDRIVLEDTQSRIENRWSAFTRFVETPNLFLLFMGDWTYHIVPKRAFAGDAEVDDFRKLLRKCVVPVV